MESEVGMSSHGSSLSGSPSCSWNLIDVLAVLFSLFVFTTTLFIIVELFVESEKISLSIFRYGGALIALCLPILWIKKKYGLNKEHLGLQKGRYSLIINILVGIIAALAVSIVFRFSPYWRPVNFVNLQASYNYLHLILLPLSISGFASFILGPLSEEVLFRGFIYGYTRIKLGIWGGLIVQALLFSFFHLNYVFGSAFYLISFYFVIGLLFGVVYERTRSLYTSIICHGLLNYMIIILSLWEK